jgi:hypothetical protein
MLLPVSLYDIARALRHALGSMSAMAVGYLLYAQLVRSHLPDWLGAPGSAVVLLLGFTLYVRGVMRVSLRTLSARPST